MTTQYLQPKSLNDFEFINEVKIDEVDIDAYKKSLKCKNVFGCRDLNEVLEYCTEYSFEIVFKFEHDKYFAFKDFDKFEILIYQNYINNFYEVLRGGKPQKMFCEIKFDKKDSIPNIGDLINFFEKGFSLFFIEKNGNFEKIRFDIRRCRWLLEKSSIRFSYPDVVFENNVVQKDFWNVVNYTLDHKFQMDFNVYDENAEVKSAYFQDGNVFFEPVKIDENFKLNVINPCHSPIDDKEYFISCKKEIVPDKIIVAKCVKKLINKFESPREFENTFKFLKENLRDVFDSYLNDKDIKVVKGRIRIKHSSLYKMYLYWCKDTDEKIKSKINFFRDIEKLNFSKINSAGIYYVLADMNKKLYFFEE